MQNSFKKLLDGYHEFRDKYVHDDKAVMKSLSINGQQPKVMVIACCDSRVDPALILQCDPGDLFVVRNVANIVPPYEKDEMHHGTSAALEFGIRSLEVKHLVLLGHSQCGGIQALLDNSDSTENDFISNWVSLIKTDDCTINNTSDYAKQALHQSHKNCITFPWIKDKINQGKLIVHLWFFDIKTGKIFAYSDEQKTYISLSEN